MFRRLLALVLVCLLGAPGIAYALPGGTPSSGAPSARTATRINDVDGDGRVDLVSVRADTVQVLFGDGEEQEVSAESLDDALSRDSLFGSGLVVGDLDQDGFADVVVTDPGAGRSCNGRVWALWGSRAGLSARHSTVLATGSRDQMIGRSVAFVPLPEPVLAISGRYTAAGGVALHRVDSSGRLGRARLIGIGSRGLSGTAWPDAEFGWSMAASGDLLAIGAAGAGPVRSSGAAYLLWLRPGLTYWSTRVVQGSRGVPGRPEAFDAFGSAVAVLGDRVAIGSAEGVRGQEAAGAVQVLRVERGGQGIRVRPGPLLTQATPGVPGRARANHLFGLDLALTRPCRGAWGVIASVGSGRSPVLVPFDGAERCPTAQLLDEGSTGATGGPFTLLRRRPAGTSDEKWVYAPEGRDLLVGRPGSWSVLGRHSGSTEGALRFAAPAA